MLFTILIGVIGGAVYSIRLFLIKLRSKLGAGNSKKDSKRVRFAIFSDNKRYFGTFEPILKEMSKRGKQVLYLTASEDDPAFKCGIEGVTAEYIGPGNKVFSRLNNLNAAILFSTTPGLDVYQWKRSPGVSCYVHIPHAANDITLYRMFGIDYYDAILLSGEYQAESIRKLEAIRSLPEKEIRIVGIPYMDVMASRLAAEGDAPPHPRTVLLAPSWGPSAILSVYGGKIIGSLLDTGYHVIVRPHPQSFQTEKELLDRIMKEYPESEMLEYNRDSDNFDVLRRSDILVSDFSGVTFDFALVYNKPVIYTDPNFDLSPYDAWWIDDPLWTVGALKRIGIQLTGDKAENIKELIDTAIDDPRFAEGRAQVRAETWQYVSEGAARAADFLIEKYESIENDGNKDKAETADAADNGGDAAKTAGLTGKEE